MTGSEIRHTPVLVQEVLHFLNLPPDGKVLDATAGLGGHAKAILEKIPGGSYIGLDRDPDALRHFDATLKRDRRVTLYHANFAAIAVLAEKERWSGFHGIVMDLGVSALQLETASRGFSFQKNGPLDMRMDPAQGESAAELLDALSESRLAHLLKRFADEPKAGSLAKRILKEREEGRLRTTLDLARVIRNFYPPQRYRDGAARVFQALRMAVNREKEALREGLEGAWKLLLSGGRLVVLTFHSVEDRLVKHFFQSKARGCVCPPQLPRCCCGKKAEALVLTKKPIRPKPAEVAANPRSRSAKLRALEKIGEVEGA